MISENVYMSNVDRQKKIAFEDWITPFILKRKKVKVSLHTDAMEQR
jgi:hypothetical protein